MEQWKRAPSIVCLRAANHLKTNRFVEADCIGILLIDIDKQSSLKAARMFNKHPASTFPEVIRMKEERLELVLRETGKSNDCLIFDQYP